MFSSRMVTTYCFLICISASLQYVSGYVAQLPNTIAEPVQISNSATPSGSLATISNGAATDLTQEEPPLDFRVDFSPRARAKSFGRIEFLDTMLVDVAGMAINPWNTIYAAHKFPALFHIAVGFVSNHSGPGLQTKHIVWALEKIFNTIVDADSYLSGNAVVYLGSSTLGVGNVYSIRPYSAPVNTSDTRIEDLAGGSPRDSNLNSALAPPDDTVVHTDPALPAYWQGNDSPFHTLPLKSNTSKHLISTGDVQMDLWYRAGGAPVDDTQVYNASIKLLIKAAEPDIEASIWPGISWYDAKDDFTLTLRPASIAHRDDVSWWESILFLSMIAVEMSKIGGRPGRFAELDGAVDVDGTLTARFCIDKGDKSGLDPQDLCIRAETPESGHYEDGSAIA